nr:hypothetical protein [Helicobacter pylori]
MKNLALFLLGVGYKKNIAFFKIVESLFKRYFLKRSLGGILVVGGELFQNTPYFFQRMGLK